MLSLALIVFSLAASAAANGYLDGKEYVYDYRGIVYSGSSRIKSQDSGYAFNVKLRIQPTGNTAIFKIDNAQKAQFNGKFEDVSSAAHEYMDLPANAEFLTRPFRVHRKDGIVTHFELAQDEPSFSVNMKRGIVTLFNLNLDHVELNKTLEEADLLELDPEDSYYKIYEDTVLGECETSYVIQQHPFKRSNNLVLNVTKIPNFHKCNNRPNEVYSVFPGHECGEADYEKSHTLHDNARYQYSIRGDRFYYIIETIEAYSDISYTPYPLKGQTISTVIKRNLKLISEEPVSKAIEVSSNLVKYDSFTYNFDYQKDFKEPVDLKEPHYMYHIIGRKVPISNIQKQIEELVDVYDDNTYAANVKDQNLPAKFVELLRSVATIGYDEINDLYNTYADIPSTGATEEQKRYRDLFMDTLVNLGTNPAFLYGKHLIDNKKMRHQEALYFVQQLQFHLKDTSETLLDELQELCNSDNLLKRSELHAACVNTLSNIVFDHCVAHYHPEGNRRGKHECPYDASLKYFNYISKLYKETDSDKMKAIYMKSMGNIGVNEILPYILPYVKGHSSVRKVDRDNAIWALRNLGLRYPDKVRDLLIPLLFNQTENYELRLDAFVLLLQQRPELSDIENLAEAIKTDRDDQVRSFVYSTFQSLASSTHICNRRLSEQAHHALNILENRKQEFKHYDYTYSKNHYFAGYYPDYDFGGSTSFAYHASDTGYIPRTLYMGLENYVGGKSMHMFGMGIKQIGLERFFDSFFGPEGSFGKQSLFNLFKKRDKREVHGAEELNEIKKMLNMTLYEYGDLHGEIYFTYMGNHLSSYQFDNSTFEQYFKEGRFVIPNIPAMYHEIPTFVYQRFMLTADNFYVIPTEAGIPILFDYKQPVYYYHKNKKSSFEVEPGFFPEDRAGGEWPEHIRAETDGHFVLDKNMLAYMGMAIPFDEVIFGAGINQRITLSLPLKLKLDFMPKDNKLKTSWTPVTPHEVFHFKYEPFTFIDSYANSIPAVLEEKYQPIKREHRHEIERNFYHDVLGLGFDLKADFENEFNDFGTWLDFYLKKDFREQFYYLYANPNFEPYHIDVRFSQANEHPTREVEMSFTYKFHAENWVIPQFPEEGFDDLEQHREDRGPVYTCALNANVVAHGDKERKIDAVASWTRDLLRSFHKVNFYYNRTPFASQETENFKVCGSSYLKYPKYDYLKFATLNTVDIDHIVKSELKVHFGKNCDSDQKFNIQGTITETEEQHEFEKRREEPDTTEHYNVYSYFYQECLKERENGIKYGQKCLQYFDLITTLHKYTFHINHKNLSESFLNSTYQLDSFLKYMFYTHSNHNEIDVLNPVDEVHIEANFSCKLPIADVRVQKPTSNSNYHNIHRPQYVGFSSDPIFEDAHVKNSISYAYCSVKRNDVFTFDRYAYSMPSLDCYKLIAKDCSAKEYFTVLAANVKHPNYRKAVKVLLGNNKVEIMPVSGDTDAIVTVNGNRINVSNNKLYLHKEKDDPIPVFYVTFRDFYYTLHSKKYGLIVEYDGEGVFIQVSPYYRAKLCGLCGNYNGQKYDGCFTPKGCHYETDIDYTYANSILNKDCDVPKPIMNCPFEGSFNCGKHKTVVLQLTSDKGEQTCFSTKPIIQCSTHCKWRTFINRNMTFHCLPANEDYTKFLLREQETRVLKELRLKRKDHEAVVSVPDYCFTDAVHKK